MDVAVESPFATEVAAESGQDPIVHLPLGDVRPSPENDQLYRPVNTADPQIVRLADSIAEHGIQEPLLITRDGWIIGGHRRHAAARLLGLETAPCRVAPIFKDADHDEFNADLDRERADAESLALVRGVIREELLTRFDTEVRQ